MEPQSLSSTRQGCLIDAWQRSRYFFLGKKAADGWRSAETPVLGSKLRQVLPLLSDLL